jgi:hypothetical protein
MDQYVKSGLVSDSKVLDIRQVDIQSGKLLDVADTTLPVFVVTFSTQEVLLFRNAKTREVVVGKEDRVEQCMYAAVVTRVEEELDDELTGGWKVVEVGARFRYTDTLADGLSTDGSPICPGVPIDVTAQSARSLLSSSLALADPAHTHTPLTPVRYFTRICIIPC